ncbi:hypothetical protein, partial [Streptomyces sp. DSM 15324]|uniref:hypothetical protein n=1 Tax=Streptomyces sp. DSM 15324 TaxID=1739111 RepID=UPI000D16427C
WDGLGSEENVAAVLRNNEAAVAQLRLGETRTPLRETADRIDVALALLDEHGPVGVTADAVARGVTPYDARHKVRLLVQWLGTPEAARRLEVDEPTVRLLRLFRETEKLTVDTASRIDTAYDSLVTRLRSLGIDPAEAPVQLTGIDLTDLLPTPATASPTTPDAPMPTTPAAHQDRNSTPDTPAYPFTRDETDIAESSENLFTEAALFLSEQWLQTSSHESVSTTGEEHVQPGTTRPATSRAAEYPEGQSPAKQRRLNDESGADEWALPDFDWPGQPVGIEELPGDFGDEQDNRVEDASSTTLDVMDTDYSGTLIDVMTNYTQMLYEEVTSDADDRAPERRTMEAGDAVATAMTEVGPGMAPVVDRQTADVAPAAGVLPVAGTAAAHPTDGAQLGEEGERAVRSGPEGAGDMAIDFVPAVDYAMVHGGDSGLPASRENEQADEAGGELLASGEVGTDRWIPFGTGEGTPEAFTFTPVPPGTRTVTRMVDGALVESDAPWQVGRPQGSGERTRIGYTWAHYRGATPVQDTLYLTRRIHLTAQDASAEQLATLQNGLRTALRDLVNRRDYRLPALQPDQVTGPSLPGPLLRADVRFVDSPADADSVVTVHVGLPGPGRSMVQNAWYTDVHPAAYVHEIVHGLGVIDDNPDPRVLLTPGGRGEQVLADGESSLMGPFTDPARQDFVLTTDHLRQIADVLSPYLHTTTTTPAEHTEPAVAQATAPAEPDTTSQPLSPPPGQTGPDTAPAVDDQTALSQLNDLVRILGSGVAVARELGVNQSTVARWLSGTRPLSADAAGRIDGLHGRLASGDVQRRETAESVRDILESLYVKERENHADDESALRAVADALSGGTVEVDRDDVYRWMSGKPNPDPVVRERIAEHAALVHPDGLPTVPADTPALHTVETQYLVNRLGPDITPRLLGVSPQVLESLQAGTSSPTLEVAERITATADLLLTQNTTPTADDVTNHVRQRRTTLQNAIADLTSHLENQAAVAGVLGCGRKAVGGYRHGGHESKVPKKTADRIHAALALLDEGRPVTADTVTERVTPDATATKLQALTGVASSERDLARELKVSPRTLRQQLDGAQVFREFAVRVDALFEQCEK